MIEAVAQNLVFRNSLGRLVRIGCRGHRPWVFGVTKFLNVAHGELLMFGATQAFGFLIF